MFTKNYGDVFKGDERWRNLPTPSGNTFEWNADSTDGNQIYLRDIWPSQKDISATIANAINQEMFTKNYADVFKGDERWRNLPTPSGDTFEWAQDSTYVRKPPYFDGMLAEPEPYSLPPSTTSGISCAA